MAGMNVNVWGVADKIASLVASKRIVDVSKLRDPTIDLDDLTEVADTQSVPFYRDGTTSHNERTMGDT